MDLPKITRLGKNVIMAFDTDQTYYRYISASYADKGEYGLSGGMQIRDGYNHLAFPIVDMSFSEHTLVHELAHACLAHRKLPLWLDEALAMHAEEYVLRDHFHASDVCELADKHRSFWGEEELRQFWSGESFSRPDQGSTLSYSLARILLNLVSDNKRKFWRFVLDANVADSGNASAEKHLGKGLNLIVAQFLGPGRRYPDFREREQSSSDTVSRAHMWEN
jgi:hypothetical protein